MQCNAMQCLWSDSPGLPTDFQCTAYFSEVMQVNDFCGLGGVQRRVLRHWKSTSGASGAKGQGRTAPSTTSRMSTTICWTGQGPSLLRWKGGQSSLWLPHRLSHWSKVCLRRRRIVARLFLWQFEMFSTSSCDDGWITGFTVVPISAFKGMTARVFLINYRVGNG